MDNDDSDSRTLQVKSDDKLDSQHDGLGVDLTETMYHFARDVELVAGFEYLRVEEINTQLAMSLWLSLHRASSKLHHHSFISDNTLHSPSQATPHPRTVPSHSPTTMIP